MIKCITANYMFPADPKIETNILHVRVRSVDIRAKFNSRLSEWVKLIQTFVNKKKFLFNGGISLQVASYFIVSHK